MDTLDYVDAVETIRVENNSHWMELVRIALEKAPDETVELLKKIIECDRRVTARMQSIVELIDG